MTTATPLGLAKFEHILTPYLSLFIGNIGGSLGETSALALLIGIAYLLYIHYTIWIPTVVRPMDSFYIYGIE